MKKHLFPKLRAVEGGQKTQEEKDEKIKIERLKVKEDAKPTKKKKEEKVTSFDWNHL